jgi:hypothetical protein
MLARIGHAASESQEKRNEDASSPCSASDCLGLHRALLDYATTENAQERWRLRMMKISVKVTGTLLKRRTLEFFSNGWVFNRGVSVMSAAKTYNIGQVLSE